jgi:hypothetical protein
MAGCGGGFALNTAPDISHNAHNARTVRAGFSVGAILAMTQMQLARFAANSPKPISERTMFQM